MEKNTRLVKAGREPLKHKGMVNVPVYRGSTVLFDSVGAYLDAMGGEDVYGIGGDGDFSYGTSGNAGARALQTALAELEGAASCVVFPSGLSALTTAMLAHLRAGAHLLVPDSVYGPVRRFCAKFAVQYGVNAEYYDPGIGEKIESLFRPETQLLMLESPGSLTMEMQDVPAMAARAAAAGITTLMDNSWATPLHYRPLDHGADLSLQACTKYIGGHSDILLGAVAGNARAMEAVKRTAHHLGVGAGPDDCYLAARGLRTLSVRLEKHSRSALSVAGELEKHPKIARVMFPALPSDPGHALWKRDFGGGGGGLFSVRLDKEYSKELLYSSIDGLSHFAVGASWGGFESLVMPFDPQTCRSVLRYEKASYIRFFVGLEDEKDLKQDIFRMLDRIS